MRFTRHEIFGIILICVTVVVLWMTFVTHRDHTGLDKVNQTCEEDMPCWNCHEDGNKVCGPNTSDQ